MFVHSAWLRYHAKVLIPATLLLVFLFHLGTRSESRFSSLYSHSGNEESVFIDNFLLNEADGAFNGSAIASLCASKKWTPGLILSCEAVPGNLADVKNGILTCLRTAIEMGSAVVLPGIIRRSQIDIAIDVPHTTGPHIGVGLGHFFDRDHLSHILDVHCPQITIYDSLDPFYEQPSMIDPVRIDLSKLPGLEWVKDVNDHGARVLPRPDHLAQKIHAYLDGRVPVKTRRYPFHVQLRPTPQYILSVSGDIDPPALYASFGRLLRVRTDLRRLAASLLFRLQHISGSFTAVELRTEADAVQAKFPSYAVQASDLLQFLVRERTHYVLLGTGATPEDEALFLDRADDFNMTVLRKTDLAEGTEVTQLRELTWDQLGLVDYEMMMHARAVAASAYSTFAWNLALRRHFRLGGSVPEEQKSSNGTNTELSNVRWQDEHTTLFGKDRVGDSRERTIWP